MNQAEEEFYVGYDNAAPPALGRWLKRKVGLCLLLSCGLAAALSVGQEPSSAAQFEFGVVRSFEGWLETTPVPILSLQRPGIAPPAASHSSYLLTVFGKQSAAPALEPSNGHYVRLQGQLIWRDQRVMLEVDPATVSILAASEQPASPPPGGRGTANPARRNRRLEVLLGGHETRQWKDPSSLCRALHRGRGAAGAIGSKCRGHCDVLPTGRTQWRSTQSSPRTLDRRIGGNHGPSV